MSHLTHNVLITYLKRKLVKRENEILEIKTESVPINSQALTGSCEIV